MNIDDEKKKIRTDIKERFSNLNQEYVRYSNNKIAAKVLNSEEYKNAKTVFCFVGTSIEIDTIPIIKYALEDKKIVGVPKCVSRGIINVYEIKALEDLSLGKYNILEPNEECRVINKEKIDLAIVPCVTCNKKGQRLGYGGGYYDRYLKTSGAKRLIICRELLMTDEIPTEEHDVLMDLVITEEHVYLR